jgi:hypothetical protein
MRLVAADQLAVSEFLARAGLVQEQAPTKMRPAERHQPPNQRMHLTKPARAMELRS